MLALRRGEVLWDRLYFGGDPRGSLGGIFGRTRNSGRGPWLIAAQRGDKIARRATADTLGRTQDPGEVEIGGARNGVAVVVEVDENRNNKAKRTQMRGACRPQQRWLWGVVAG